MSAGVAFDTTYREMFLMEIAAGKSMSTAAEIAGYSPRTVKRHLESDAEFRADYAEAQEVATGKVEDVLYERATKGGGDLGAIKFWLANRGERGRWVDERDRGAGGGQQIASPTLIIGAMREMLTDPTTQQGAVAAILSVPLPIETTATEQ